MCACFGITINSCPEIRANTNWTSCAEQHRYFFNTKTIEIHSHNLIEEGQEALYGFCDHDGF